MKLWDKNKSRQTQKRRQYDYVEQLKQYHEDKKWIKHKIENEDQIYQQHQRNFQSKIHEGKKNTQQISHIINEKDFAFQSRIIDRDEIRGTVKFQYQKQKKVMSTRLNKTKLNLHQEDEAVMYHQNQFLKTLKMSKKFSQPYKNQLMEEKKQFSGFLKKQKKEEQSSNQYCLPKRLQKSITLNNLQKPKTQNPYDKGKTIIDWKEKEEDWHNVVDKYLHNDYDNSSSVLNVPSEKMYNNQFNKKHSTLNAASSYQLKTYLKEQYDNKSQLDTTLTKSFPKSTQNLFAISTFNQKKASPLLNSLKYYSRKEIKINKLQDQQQFSIQLSKFQKNLKNVSVQNLKIYKTQPTDQKTTIIKKPKRQFQQLKMQKVLSVQLQSKRLHETKLLDFKRIKKLGEGRFGSVTAEIHKKTGAIFALKCIEKKKILSNGLTVQLSLELRIQSCIKSPHIVKLYGWFEDTHIYLVLQYMEGGTLYKYMKKEGKLQSNDAADKVKQIAEAVHTMQQEGVVHRDIKPQNIVLSYGVCKLCDFGWATYCNEERRKTYCGTTDYVAPQIIMGLQYDTSVDLWCLGILIYELAVGKAPFYHISTKETMNKIINVDENPIFYPEWLNYNCKNIVQKLLKKNPQQRMTANQLLKHKWLKSTEIC